MKTRQQPTRRVPDGLRFLMHARLILHLFFISGCASPFVAESTDPPPEPASSRDWIEVAVPDAPSSRQGWLFAYDPVLEAEVDGPGKSILDSEPFDNEGPPELFTAGWSRVSDEPPPVSSSPIRPAPELIEPIRAFSFKCDARGLPATLRDDALSCLTSENAVFTGGMLAAALVLRQDADDEVRRWTARHPKRWGDATTVLGGFGGVEYQIPAIAAVYGYSLKTQNEELHDMSVAMISAFGINGLTTGAIKLIANTERPSRKWVDGRYGFPSYHTSSGFTIASVLHEYYGSRVGVPAYALAGLVGWSRIDERDHDLSDVVFGATLGYVIGRSVARNHLDCTGTVRFSPWIHPDADLGGFMVSTDF